MPEAPVPETKIADGPPDPLRNPDQYLKQTLAELIESWTIMSLLSDGTLEPSRIKDANLEEYCGHAMRMCQVANDLRHAAELLMARFQRFGAHRLGSYNSSLLKSLVGCNEKGGNGAAQKVDG